MARQLTVAALLRAGFEEVGCWTVSEVRITPPANLPAKRGVYAFAIGEQVMYVGLASRSIKQRLGFYARPGASQRTNVRLNAIIRDHTGSGATVRVLLAHPEDGAWNGFRLSGPGGLEAALIEDFDLPWNMRGSASPPATAQASYASALPPSRLPRGSTPSAIIAFVTANPGCTELQIAKGVFGPDAVQPRANSYCRRLAEGGLLDRLPTRPVTYRVPR
jgi:hypothetical protein